jgi:ribosomal protein S27E
VAAVASKRVEIEEHQRPRRLLGALLRKVLRCPLCAERLKVLWYGKAAVRLECRNCGLQFTADPAGISRAISRAAVHEFHGEWEGEDARPDELHVFNEYTAPALRRAAEVELLAVMQPSDSPERRRELAARVYKKYAAAYGSSSRSTQPDSDTPTPGSA